VVSVFGGFMSVDKNFGVCSNFILVSGFGGHYVTLKRLTWFLYLVVFWVFRIFFGCVEIFIWFLNLVAIM